MEELALDIRLSRDPVFISQYPLLVAIVDINKLNYVDIGWCLVSL